MTAALLARSRLIGCAVLALSLVGGAAGAGPAASCHLLTDPAGDTEIEDQPPPVPAPSLDIVGGDVATDGNTVTAVIRVDDLPELDLGAPNGMNVQLHFTVERRKGRTVVERKGFVMEAARSRAYDDFFYLWTFVDYLDYGEDSIWTLAPLGPVTGVFDRAAGEVRIHAPLGQLRMKARPAPGDRIVNIQGWSYYENGFASPTESRRPFGGGAAIRADWAKGTTPYAVGSRSCVPVGR